MASGYEAALSTRKLAVHCIACGRSLRDAVSVELGIGPICRAEYLPAVITEEARIEANALIHWLAAEQESIQETYGIETFLGALARLRELGFDRLSTIAAERFVPVTLSTWTDPEGQSWISLRAPYDPEAVTAMRKIKGRQWNQSQKLNLFRPSTRPAVWELLKRFYRGLNAFGPKGAFTIQEEQS